METFVNENKWLLSLLVLVLIGWGVFIWYVKWRYRREDEALGSFFKSKIDALEEAKAEGNLELYQQLLESAKTQASMMRKLFS